MNIKTSPKVSKNVGQLVLTKASSQTTDQYINKIGKSSLYKAYYVRTIIVHDNFQIPLIQVAIAFVKKRK